MKGRGPPEGHRPRPRPHWGDGDLTILDVWHRDGTLCDVGGQNDLPNKEERNLTLTRMGRHQPKRK